MIDFDFELRRGEVHALIGSNGAGKSTFAKILTGLTLHDSGQIFYQEKAFRPTSKHEASMAGINMVLQELNIIPTLTIAENLFLHHLPTSRGILDRRYMHQEAKQALRRVGLETLDPDALAGSLGVGQQQLLEIAGALGQDSRILILDEPTAALTGPEIEKLFANIRSLKSEGVALIYISHRMDEIQRIADRVTVLRDGRRISTHDTEKVALDQLVREMAGQELAERRPHTEIKHRGPGLRVEMLSAPPAVREVSFQVDKGEILGIAGLVGAGRTETLRAIFGADPRMSGDIFLGDSQESLSIKSPADALAAGIGLIPEDRKTDGLFIDKSIVLNSTLSTLRNHGRAGVIDAASETEATRKVSDRLALKRDSLEQNVAELSGGNQQKVVMGRWLLCDCEVLLFDEPTRGIDVAAKESIYNLLDELAAEGKALVVVSSDLLELMTISHRILVMSAGVIAGEFLPDSWTQEAITAASFSEYTQTTGAAK
ncbi:MAG: sugar ABC transporter ATP-binding protein [Verrucomicrobiae bacterium]|nr:sugar ABC transporter ATP-binding protein [Verrucomicrobiae bacterium]